MSGSVKFPGLKVGDTVVVCRNVHGTESKFEAPREVIKVGRKYFTIGAGSEKWPAEEDYSLEDGRLRGSQYGYPYAMSIAEFESLKELKSAKESLRKFGIDLGYSTSKDRVLLMHRALMSYSSEYAASLIPASTDKS